MSPRAMSPAFLFLKKHNEEGWKTRKNGSFTEKHGGNYKEKGTLLVRGFLAQIIFRTGLIHSLVFDFVRVEYARDGRLFFQLLRRRLPKFLLLLIQEQVGSVFARKFLKKKCRKNEGNIKN